MESTKNKKLNIFLICFLVTCLLMISKKTDIIKTIGDTLNIRYLFDNPKIDYICDKAGNSLKKNILTVLMKNLKQKDQTKLKMLLLIMFVIQNMNI